METKKKTCFYLINFIEVPAWIAGEKNFYTYNRIIRNYIIHENIEKPLSFFFIEFNSHMRALYVPPSQVSIVIYTNLYRFGTRVDNKVVKRATKIIQRNFYL